MLSLELVVLDKKNKKNKKLLLFRLYHTIKSITLLVDEYIKTWNTNLESVATSEIVRSHALKMLDIYESMRIINRTINIITF